MESTKNDPRIEVIDRQEVFPVDAARIEAVARRVLVGRPGPASVNLVFTDDATIHDLNRRFLGHDYPTDVITFPGDPGPEDPEAVDGEIVVSVETAVREASERGIDPAAEIALYCVHGLLHLAGFDDRAPEAAAEMHSESLRLLAEAGFDVSRLGDLLEGEDG